MNFAKTVSCLALMVVALGNANADITFFDENGDKLVKAKQLVKLSADGLYEPLGKAKKVVIKDHKIGEIEAFCIELCLALEEISFSGNIQGGNFLSLKGMKKINFEKVNQEFLANLNFKSDEVNIDGIMGEMKATPKLGESFKTVKKLSIHDGAWFTLDSNNRPIAKRY